MKSYEVVKRRHYDCSLICDISDLDEKLGRKALITEVLTRGATIIVVGGKGGHKCKMYCHNRQ